MTVLVSLVHKLFFFQTLKPQTSPRKRMIEESSQPPVVTPAILKDLFQGVYDRLDCIQHKLENLDKSGMVASSIRHVQSEESSPREAQNR